MTEQENNFSPEYLYRAIFRMHRGLSQSLLYKGVEDYIQWNILHILSRENSIKNPPSQKEIASELAYSPATITGMLKEMQKNGLIEKQYDPDDLRRNRIVATELGLQRIKQHHENEWTLDEQMHAGFTAEEKAQLSSYYLRICDNLIKMGANCPRFLRNKYEKNSN